MKKDIKDGKSLELFAAHGNLCRNSIEEVDVEIDQGKANVAYCDLCSSYSLKLYVCITISKL